LAGVLVYLLIFVSGCVEPFAAGVATGATAMEKLAEQSQSDLIATVNEMHAKKAEYDAIIDSIEDAATKEALQTLIDKQTIEAIEKLSEADWKDPKVISGYALALLGLVTAGYQKKQRVEENKAAQ